MKLGIIGAMDFEVERLIEQMDMPSRTSRAGVDIYLGMIRGVKCAVVISGIGKVNAAMCTQLLISEFEITHMINTGVAGAIKDSLNPGDVVISTDLMEHDMDLTGDGKEYGEIARMDTSVFAADEFLRQAARRSAEKTIADYQIVEDRIVSGDVFVSDYERKAFILKHFNAAATEMEGAAIAHVCYLNKIPFVIIRAMSDKADGSATVDYDVFFEEAAKRSSNMVLDMIETLHVS